MRFNYTGGFVAFDVFGIFGGYTANKDEYGT
jgi:hypothetical protein